MAGLPSQLGLCRFANFRERGLLRGCARKIRFSAIPSSGASAGKARGGRWRDEQFPTQLGNSCRRQESRSSSTAQASALPSRSSAHDHAIAHFRFLAQFRF